jgi:hypothetical protein
VQGVYTICVKAEKTLMVKANVVYPMKFSGAFYGAHTNQTNFGTISQQSQLKPLFRLLNNTGYFKNRVSKGV